MTPFIIVVFASVVGYLFLGTKGALIAGAASGAFLFRYTQWQRSQKERSVGLSPALLKLIEDKRLAESGSDAARLRRQYRETPPTPKMNMPNVQRLRKSLAPMLVQLMKIDDQELDVEARVIDQFLFLLGFSPQDASLLRRQMSQLSKHAFDPYQLSRELTVFTVEERTLLMEGLYRVTFADGIFHPSEEAYLRQVAAVLELDENFYVLQSQAGRARVHQGFGEKAEYTEEEACLILGLVPNSSTMQRKERYKELRWFYRTLIFPNLEANLNRLRDRALREIHKAWLVFELDLNDDVPTTQTPPKPIQMSDQPVAELRPAFQPHGREAKAAPSTESSLVEQKAVAESVSASVDPLVEAPAPASPEKKAEQSDSEALSATEIRALFATFKDFDRSASEQALSQLVQAGEAVFPVFLEVVDELMMRDWLERYLSELGQKGLPLLERALQEEGRSRDWLLKTAAEAAGQHAKPLLARFLNHSDFLYQSTAERALKELGVSAKDIAAMKES